MLGISQRNGRNGLLKQTCRANLLSAVHHILRTSAAERLAAPPTVDKKAQSPKPFSVLQWSHGTIGDRNIPEQVLETTTPWPNPLLPCIRLVCSATATKAWAWCNHNAELVECAAALRDLKLLVGSGLIFHKRHGILRQACRKNLLSAVRQWHVLRHGQLKGWKPHFQPTVAKSSISTHCNSMANGKNHVPIFRNKPWRPQLRDQTYSSLHETQIQNLGQRDWIFCKHNASIMQSWWSVLPLSGSSSFWYE